MKSCTSTNGVLSIVGTLLTSVLQCQKLQRMLHDTGTSESGDDPGAPAAVDNSAAEGAQDGEERSRLAALAAGSMRVSFATPPPRQVRELRHVDGSVRYWIVLLVTIVNQPRWLFAEQFCYQEKQ
jgi:hypothetical protein